MFSAYVEERSYVVVVWMPRESTISGRTLLNVLYFSVFRVCALSMLSLVSYEIYTSIRNRVPSEESWTSGIRSWPATALFVIGDGPICGEARQAVPERCYSAWLTVWKIYDGFQEYPSRDVEHIEVGFFCPDAR